MKVITRKIKCRVCGFTGVIEAIDTKDYPPKNIFRQKGKDSKGYLHFKCPSCREVRPYSPYYFINPSIKIAFCLILALILWGSIEWLTG
jgi:hypothetical protein